MARFDGAVGPAPEENKGVVFVPEPKLKPSPVLDAPVALLNSALPNGLLVLMGAVKLNGLSLEDLNALEGFSPEFVIGVDEKLNPIGGLLILAFSDCVFPKMLETSFEFEPKLNLLFDDPNIFTGGALTF